MVAGGGLLRAAVLTASVGPWRKRGAAEASISPRPRDMMGILEDFGRAGRTGYT